VHSLIVCLALLPALNLNKVTRLSSQFRVPQYYFLHNLLSPFTESGPEKPVMGGRYEYQKVFRFRREIRLLELLPSNHHLSKFRPACRMFHASLDTKPRFLALSYVWGDENDKRVILVNKHPFWVTRNLFDAMMGLRESESLIMWIDAICIN
jgi:hypothetical protein